MAVANKDGKEKGTGDWYVSWRDETQKQQTKFFGKGDIAKAQAEEFDAKIRLEKKLGRSTIPVNKPKLRLDKLAQAYINHLRTDGKNGQWLDDLINLLNKHWVPKLVHKPVDALTKADIDEFINENYPLLTDEMEDRYTTNAKEEKVRRVKQITRQRYLSYLKIIFAFGVEHEHTTKNPLQKWTKDESVEKQRDVFLTVEDLTKILNHAALHVRVALHLVWHTGIRPGPQEQLSVKWDHIDFGRNVIIVADGKGGSSREVPMNPVLRTLLLEQKEVSKAIAGEGSGNLRGMLWNMPVAESSQ